MPSRRLVDMARYGMSAKSQQIIRHPQARRLAMLLSTVVYLESKATDDALDLLMTTDLLGKAERESEKEKARRHPRLARASAKLAAAVEVLFKAAEWGEEVTRDARQAGRADRDSQRFLKVLTEVIVFGATEDGGAVLAAMKALPRLLDGRRRKELTAADVDAELVRGSWRLLVFPGEGKGGQERVRSVC